MVKLRYVSDATPGISRKKKGKLFQYFDAAGCGVDDDEIIQRINALAIPPAYESVWICPLANGHIQATGMDAAARKQYRYHADWTAFRDQQKFEKLGAFSAVLPKIRSNVNRILASAGSTRSLASKDTAIASVVRLIDNTAMRVGGKSKTARGATTLEMGNLRYGDGLLKFKYRAKGGKRVQCTVRDDRLLRVLQTIDDLPGKRLFQYLGEDGDVHPLDSGCVNQWLKDVSGNEELSAKVFRTWHGSTAALDAMYCSEKASIKLAAEASAAVLHNTPTISRKSYIHPAILDLAGSSYDERRILISEAAAKINGLRQNENRLAGFLKSL
jgi:DNA topoisomerase I